MSNFEADARVVVRADTKPFRTELLKAIKSFEDKAVKVKVVPDTRGFQKLLQAEVLAAAKKVTARVKVVPDMRGFRTAVQAAVRDATAGAGIPAGGRGGGRAAAAPRPRGPAPLLSSSGKRLTGAAAEAKKEALARQAEQLKVLKVVQAAEVKAHIDNMARDKARAAADEKARVAAVEAAEKTRAARLAAAQKAGLVSASGQPLTGAAADAKAEALEREKAQLDALRKIQAAEIKAHAHNVKLDKARAAADEKARLKVLADLQAAGLLSATGTPLRGAALDARREAQERAAAAAALQKKIGAAHEKAFDDDIKRDRQRAASDLRNRLDVEEKIALARSRIRTSRRGLEETRAFVPEGDTAVVRARAALGKTTEAVATAERAFTSTIGTNDRALQFHAATTLRDVRALEVLQAELLKTAVAEEKAAAAGARRRSFGFRGFVSQLATFAGLRGAVLSANAAFIAGTVAAIAFGKAVQSAAQLESELNVFRVVSGATADEMERVSETARRLGADITLPSVGAVDAAQAIAQLSKAGLDVQDSIAGARGVLQLATAAEISNAEATELAASALNAFGLAGADAVHVADVLTNAANEAQGSISDVGIALQQSAAVARQVGVSFEDTVALLTLLARNGIRGSDAGTALRVAFTRLTAPTAQAAAVLKELNVQVLDAQGNLRPEIFSDISEAMSEMSREQQNANAKTIFGVDALRAYAIAAREGVPALNATRDALAEQGSAAELAGARMSGLTGQIENLKNQLNTAGLAMGQVVIPSLSALAGGAADSANELNLLAGDLRALIALGKEAKEIFPIDFGGGGDDDSISPIPSTFERFLPPQIKPFLDFREQIKAIMATSAGEAREQVKEIVESLNSVGGGGIFNLNEAVLDLQKLSAELATGDEEAQKMGVSIDSFIKQLQNINSATGDPVNLNIEIPEEILTGKAAQAGSAAADAFERKFQLDSQQDFGFGAFFQGIESSAEASANRFFAPFLAAARRFVRELKQEMQAATGALNVLEGEALDIQIEGGPNEERRLLKNLEKREVILREAVETQRTLLKPGAKSSPGLREAQAALDENLDRQEEFREGFVRDAEEARDKSEADAEKIKNAQNDADQALLDAFGRRVDNFDARAFLADQSESLKNDLAIEKARKKFLFSRFAFFRRTIKGAEALRDALRTLRDQLRKTDAEIDSLQKQIAEDQRTAAQEAADAAFETITKRAELAGLRGNEGNQLRFIDAAIANRRKELNRLKGLGKATLDVELQIERLIDQREEIQKKAKDGAEGQGTTAFELLQASAQTFVANAGNLIGGNQPFAGPTGFTADLAQFLVRQQSAGKTSLTQDRVGGKTKFELNDDRLVRSMERLADVMEGKTGNSSTAALSTRAVDALGQRGAAMARYWEAKNKRDKNQSRSESEGG